MDDAAPRERGFASLGLERWQLAVLALALIILSLAFQGNRGLYETTEGRYASVAHEMIRTGDWMTPHLDDEHLHLTKPPVTYWLIAGSMEAFGRNEFAARLPGALAFMLSTLLVLYGARFFTPRSPLFPAVVFATFLQTGTAANIVSTDDLLALAETAAMLAFAAHYFGTSRGRGYAVLGWGLFGAAFMVKGFPALLPLGGLAIFHWQVRRRFPDKQLFVPLGLLLFAVIGLTWYLVLIARDPSLLGYFLGDELVGRVAGMHHRNAQWYRAITIYGPVLLIGSVPWTIETFRSMRPPLVRFWQSLRRRPPGERISLELEDRFLALWFFVPLVVFIVVRSRLELYLLPLFAPLALMTARYMGAQALTRRSIRIRALCGFLLVLALRPLAVYVPTDRDNRAVAEQLRGLAGPPPSEIVFVSTTPYRGLAVYMNVEVERVDFDEEGARREGVDTLAEELADDEPGRLWMVRDNAEQRFLDAVAASGRSYQPSRIGTYMGKHPNVVYRLR